MSKLISITDDVLDSSGIVLVDFYDTWCSPCKALLPILEEVSNLVDIKIAKVNIEENDKLVKEYKITSLPTLKLIKDNQVIATKIGMVSKSQLLSFIEEHCDK
jgi:thioredoxin 1